MLRYSAEMRDRERIRRRRVWGLSALVVCVPLVAGCKSTFSADALKSGPRSLAGLAQVSADDDRPTIDNVMGPTERKLKQTSWEREQQEAAANGTIDRIPGLAQYQAAEKLYQAGRYREAEQAFKALAKERANRGLSFTERAAKAFQSGMLDSSGGNDFGDPVEEDALFMLAESQFKQKKYSWAQDSYDRLLEKYPSSRHLNDVTRRLFTIAQTWMGFPAPGEDDNVELASGELKKLNPRVGDRSFKRPSFINVTDRSRPVFDTAGRALQALQSIWLNDANGPLADDALMLTANYHLQTGDFVEAARVYQLLREQYPDSPHFKDAYLLDSHVRLASYEGPAYDDRALRESRELRETAQRLFPDLSQEQRERLERELERIEISEVEREWHKVLFYRRKGNEASMALHCNKILNKYPDSPFAESARRTLAEIAENRRQQTTSPLSRLIGSKPPEPSPVFAGIESYSATTHQTAREAAPEQSAAPATPQQPGLIKRALTPVDRAPNLQPVDPAGQTSTRPNSRPPTRDSTAPRRSLF